MAELTVQRHEEKYLINAAQKTELELLLRPLLHCDGGGSYLVRSLYFDTPADSDYAAKVLGLHTRKKLRLRVYSPAASDVKLEIKNKQGSLFYKQSALLTRLQAEMIIRGEYDFLLGATNETCRRAYALFKAEARRAAVLVDYDRTAFTAPAGQVRITLDSHIRAAKTDRIFDAAPPLVALHSGAYTVLEVKYSGFLPGYLRGVLSSVQPLRTAASKYALAREVLY